MLLKVLYTQVIKWNVLQVRNMDLGLHSKQYCSSKGSLEQCQSQRNFLMELSWLGRFIKKKSWTARFFREESWTNMFFNVDSQTQKFARKSKVFYNKVMDWKPLQENNIECLECLLVQIFSPINLQKKQLWTEWFLRKKNGLDGFLEKNNCVKGSLWKKQWTKMLLSWKVRCFGEELLGERFFSKDSWTQRFYRQESLTERLLRDNSWSGRIMD